jgi:predicted peptidase
MITRREAICLLGTASAGALFAAAQNSSASTVAPKLGPNVDPTPPVAPGTPTSVERTALIEAFKKQSEGLEKKFEARVYEGEWTMPYRLFRPEVTGKVPLVLYLHGSGGLGDDNLKQLSLGNVFGTRLWLLPQNQKSFPCYVVVPQTDRGWIRYDPAQWAQGVAKAIPGLGDGARLALEVVDALCREFAIDQQRIYVTGQSMGGAGTWNVITNRPRLFAAAVICCGSISTEDGTGAIDTPLWNFNGDSDQTVAVSTSRDRMAARRKAGGHPLYTEYSGVDHNVWQWAYTEPELLKWVFAQQRGKRWR